MISKKYTILILLLKVLIIILDYITDIRTTQTPFKILVKEMVQSDLELVKKEL